MMPSGNLIPAARLLKRQRRRLVRRWGLVVVSYALAMGVAIPVASYALAPSEALGKELEVVQRKAQASEARLVVTREALAEARATLNATRLVENQADWSILLAVLSEALGEDTVLKRCHLVDETVTSPKVPMRKASGASSDAPEEEVAYVVELNGYGMSQSAVSQFVLRLERSGVFSQVTLQESRREAFLRDQAIAFRLRCVMATEEPQE